MRILFCSDPLNNRSVDVDYELEMNTAKSLGFKVDLIQLEDILDHKIQQALRQIEPSHTLETVIYRGWMLSPENYEKLYQGLLKKNLKLINSPSHYVTCHYFPNAYHVIKDYTPKSKWIDIEAVHQDYNTIYEVVAEFHHQPILIKDYVKSRKHEWEDACFIPDASDKKQLDFVVKNFIERQGQDLNGGLVFREFIPLEKVAEHPKSGMPLSREYRLMFYNRQLLQLLDYWEEVTYDNEPPSLDGFITLASQLNSNFFSIDIGKTVDGRWIIIEVGDGQVSGLPENVVEVEKFYKSLSNES
ncbi:ATP-grasp domain-containing protein [Lysinibacillus sp. fls2-241-R2A-57]|uniref:ATP-grasp domain-containing protein n=1 Tax=Lysinibacillus sp. fls2-241-R2A-57 TaxID=3040292 RepID=UPI002553D571|nr:ATP-grasp domain-containing protein [Lysinibacillus sp. fls2-241-R2A-57]